MCDTEIGATLNTFVAFRILTFTLLFHKPPPTRFWSLALPKSGCEYLLRDAAIGHRLYTHLIVCHISVSRHHDLLHKGRVRRGRIYIWLLLMWLLLRLEHRLKHGVGVVVGVVVVVVVVD